ncbi:MAG TPA: hypothetical protein VF157_05555 [Chloroflexota bacterium]
MSPPAPALAAGFAETEPVGFSLAAAALAEAGLAAADAAAGDELLAGAAPPPHAPNPNAITTATPAHGLMQAS